MAQSIFCKFSLNMMNPSIIVLCRRFPEATSTANGDSTPTMIGDYKPVLYTFIDSDML